MATDVATLAIRVLSGDVVTADRRLASMTATGGKAETMAAALGRSFRLVDDGASKAAKSVAGLGETSARASASAIALRRVFGGLGFAYVTKEAIGMADAMTNISSRLGLVTHGSAQLAAVQEALFATAQRARVGYEGTADLYAKLARNSAQLGASQSDLLRVTETISKAFAVSGGSAESNRAALIQLGQAMASGSLRGDELRSVLEQTPRLAQAIADGLGVTIGQLRKMGEEGKLTAESVFNALKSQGAAIDAEFAKMPITVGGAMTQVKNATLLAIGEFDKMTGSSRAVAEALSGIASGISELVAYKGDIVAIALAIGGVATALWTAQKAALALTAIQASKWFFALQAVAGGAATAVEGVALALGSTATAGTGLAAVLGGVVVAPLVSLAALATAGALAIYVLKKAIDEQDEAAEEATKNTKEYVEYLKALGRAHAHAPGKDDGRPAAPPAAPFDKAVVADLAQRDQEIAKQNALNAAFGSSSAALAKLANEYDARAERAKNAVGHTVAETAALNRRTESMRKAREVAIELAEAEALRVRVRGARQTGDDAVQSAKQALELSQMEEKAAARRRVDLEAENDLRRAWRDYQNEIATLDVKRDADQIAAAQKVYELTVKSVQERQKLERQTVVNVQARDESKEAREKAERDLERDVRRVSKKASDIVYEALDAIGHRKSPFQAWLDAAKSGINRLLSDIAGNYIGGIYEKLRGRGPDAAATKNVTAATGMNAAADKMIAAAQMMAGAVMGRGGVPTAPGTSNSTQQEPAGMSRGMQRALGFAGIALGGFQTGNAVGGSLYSTSHGTAGNYVRGALGGAASGALAGAAIGSVVPVIGTAVGAVVGGVAGFVGGILGVGSASKEAKRHLAELQKTLADDMASLRAKVTGDALAEGKVEIEADRERRRKAIEEAYQGGGRNSDTVRKRNELLKEMNALEDQSLRQLERRVALEQSRQKEDYEARRDRATPGNEAAEAEADFLRGQRREREDLIASFGSEIDAREKATLAALDSAQAAELAAEKAKGFGDAIAGATASVRNAPAGFWVEQYTRDFAVRRPSASQLTPGATPSDARPGIPARPAAVFPNATINVTPPADASDPVEWAKKMLEGVRRLTDLTGINMTFADVALGAGI